METTYPTAMRFAFLACLAEDMAAGRKWTPLHKTVLAALRGRAGLIRRKTMVSVTRAR